MHDTSRTAEKKLLEIMKYKSDIEKFIMGASMADMARTITRAAILEERPDISENEYRVEFFRRWYGEDFDIQTNKKIMEALAK